MRSPRLPLHLALTLLLVVLLIASLWVGEVAIPASEMWHLLRGEGSPLFATIVWEIRLPRTLIAATVGASLGVCGAAVQGLLRNPLASPDLTGATGGGALGAVVMIYFGAASLLGVALGGMLGALAATTLVYRLAGSDGSGLTLILAGVAVGSFSVALISLLLNLAPNPYAVQEIIIWMLGSVSNLGWAELYLLLPLSLLAWLLLVTSGRGLDALTLGPETAHTLGFQVAALHRRIFLANALAVGSAVSITGAIGFVGLVIPHLLRPLVGWMPGRLLLPSALGGASLVLLADLVTRLLVVGNELKIGVVTSLIGAPFFLYLILRTRRRTL